jgi:hypothetical protein
MKNFVQRIFTSGLCLASFLMIQPLYASCSSPLVSKLQTEVATVGNEHQIPLQKFSKLEVVANFHVIVTQKKGSPRLTLRTNDNWKDVVRLAVDSDRLMIQPQKGRYFDADKAGRMLLYLEVENLSEVKLQGSGNIEFARSFKADNLQLELVGSGDIDFQQSLRCQNSLNIKLQGSGDIDFNQGADAKEVNICLLGSGDVTSEGMLCSQNKMKVDLQGSGDIDMKKIKAYNAEISLMGSGDFEADDADLATLNASVQGVGNMDLKGRVESVNYSVLGSGVINAAQLKAKRVKVNVNGSGTLKCHADELLEGSVENRGSLEISGKSRVEVSSSRHGTVRRL